MCVVSVVFLRLGFHLGKRDRERRRGKRKERVKLGLKHRRGGQVGIDWGDRAADVEGASEQAGGRRRSVRRQRSEA